MSSDPLIAALFAHNGGVKVKLIRGITRYAVMYMTEPGWLHLRDVIRLGLAQQGRILIVRDNRPNTEARLYGAE